MSCGSFNVVPEILRIACILRGKNFHLESGCHLSLASKAHTAQHTLPNSSNFFPWNPPTRPHEVCLMYKSCWYVVDVTQTTIIRWFAWWKLLKLFNHFFFSDLVSPNNPQRRLETDQCSSICDMTNGKHSYSAHWIVHLKFICTSSVVSITFELRKTNPNIAQTGTCHTITRYANSEFHRAEKCERNRRKKVFN